MAENGNSEINRLRNLKYDLKQDIIRIVSPPSLKYLILLRVAIDLWYKKILLVESRALLKKKGYGIIVDIFLSEIITEIADIKIPNECKIELKPLITIIGENLFDFLAFEICSYPKLKKLRNFLDNIVWTQQGTINPIKSVTNFIDDMNLSLLDKFDLACNYCLEEKILYYMEMCSKDIPEVFDESIEEYHLVIFWIMRINENLDQFSSIADGVPTYEYLLTWAISHHREAAVQYIWENYADESMKGRVLEFVNLILVSSDPKKLIFYFFTQINKTQIKALDVTIHVYLITKVYSLSKYCNLISVSKYAIELFQNFDIDDSMKLLINCLDQKLLNMEEFETIWKAMVVIFKPKFETDFIDICKRSFREGSFMHIMVLAKSLLKLGSYEDVKTVIYKQTSLRYFLHEFEHKPELIDVFFHTILTENDIYKYKIKLLDNNSFIFRLIRENEYKRLDNFLNIFCVEMKTTEFKRKLPYKRHAYIMFSILTCHRSFKNFDAIKSMNEFINWSFDGNKKEMARCKETIFNFDTNLFQAIKRWYLKELKILLKKNMLEFAKYFLCFVIHTNEEKISSQKQQLTLFKKIMYFIYGDFERCITYDLSKRRLLLTVYKRPGENNLFSEFNKIETLFTLSIESSFVMKLVNHFDIDNFKSLLRWFNSVFKYISFLKTEGWISPHATKNKINFQNLITSENYQLIEHKNKAHKMYYLFDWFSSSNFSKKIDFILFDKKILKRAYRCHETASEMTLPKKRKLSIRELLF